MLEIIGLSKHYGDVKAVTDLNLTVEEGEIFTMLGANGAGKTTTLMVALGFTEPTKGTVKLCGIDITEQPLEAKKYVAYVSENVMLYGNFSARQNLDFFTRLSGQPPQDAAQYDQIMARVGLQPEAFDRRVKAFSKGMRQKLGIAIAIAKDARHRAARRADLRPRSQVRGRVLGVVGSVARRGQGHLDDHPRCVPGAGDRRPARHHGRGASGQDAQPHRIPRGRLGAALRGVRGAARRASGLGTQEVCSSRPSLGYTPSILPGFPLLRE